MEQLTQIIHNHIEYAPFIICGALLFAGLGFPISEDAMLFISGILAFDNPEQLVPLFVGVYMGAYLSDLIAYTMGRKFGPKLWKVKALARVFSPRKVERVTGFYQKYGVTTLIVGRFIPFGVRNALFFTAGMIKMKIIKFALADLIACTISTVFFFTLYYKLGEAVIIYVKRGNLLVFGLAGIAVLCYIVIYYWRKKKTR